MDNQYKKFQKQAELLKVLSHPVRLCIVKGLLEKERCNVSYMQHCLELPQSSISSHLQKLRSADIVACERKGLEVTYWIADERVKSMLDILFPHEEE
ncbi:metalloregulator ArsR/SmtB family transcription factor [Paenibacillus chondroitinus]|uniref:Metalloregulator ArsR/SmtB family transcription factor n=1 Tax=Paenibacillus chondroitinus TaxID=59842 RepID=A0ABU6DMA5_9BACL|nr:metalloregulator ArsR/SmtB family transcription factor [Paenibacillus chondroitinus]MCY9657159.1 metalloregulator ArsR/SmtB family transcription factor [Paenibacillus anseongense]MEB4798442.1 metalloregulator ArsR/SmtB family transcription factor [Paenibacillus chondroitinus]